MRRQPGKLPINAHKLLVSVYTLDTMEFHCLQVTYKVNTQYTLKSQVI
jgi:hypothetical protein